MKKYIALLIPLFVFLFKSVALAAEVAPNGETYNYHYTYTAVYSWNNQRVTADIWTDGKWASFGSDSGGVIYVCPDQTFVTPTTGTLNYSGADYYKNGNPNSNQYYRNYVSFGGSVGNQSYYGTASPIVTSNIENFSTRDEAEAYLLEVDIDWDNIYYDPMIPTPNFSVTYTNDASTLPRFPVEVSLNNSSSNYFAEIIMENMTPSFVGVRPDGTYEALRYYQFESNIIYDKRNLVDSSTITPQLLSGSLSAAWRSDILSFDNTDSNSFYIAISDSPTFANSLQFSTLCGFYDSFRQIGCFYGNNSSISVRYFRVTEDGQVFASKVKSWTNMYGGLFSESLPDYYKPYATAQGYEKTSDDIIPIETSNPDTSAPANQYGTKTGLTININTGSNVPNYPDYPTIATYNTDNLLVNAIDTAKQLPQFFSSSIGIFNELFNGLLPDPFWGIIMTGFLFSIVIMIIKVL